MRTFLLMVLASLPLAALARSQDATLKPAADYVIVVREPDQPKLVAYNTDLTLNSVVNSLMRNDFDHIPRVNLVRGGNSEQYEMKRLRRDPSKDPALRAWDIVCIPEVMF